MTGKSRGVRIQLMIAFMCAALVVYLVLLGRAAVLMISSGRAVAIALGGALLILPAIGLWAMIATLRAGLAHQKLARLAAEDGMELDVSALPRRPSGRIERDAADALFDTVRTELEAIRMIGVGGIGWPVPTTTRRSKPRPRSHEESRRTTGSPGRMAPTKWSKGRDRGVVFGHG